ncbi:EAL domain-containing protein [Bacillus sp. es.034]|uniref:EAL domain-containing protein n=1 Tax=Bacillus sp. es.034 TaxID=1761763 RepID=UPI000BF9C694|nr:EAL domain-containing protein [Bacillus sp. es.034]PFG06913.1 EAL domain-containing protein (putative c-di-GMP-specific phosphodiesterase class I) [Bacillus sp. es.034]
MDALEILSNIEKVIPYFQPIFSADEHKIIGYEVFGRMNMGSDGVESLGPFFGDDEIPDEYKMEVDERVTRLALEKFLAEKQEGYIFLNRNARLLMLDHGESFLDLLLEYEKKGLDLSRTVIELSEKTFVGDFDQLVHLLLYYKTYGIKIAIDNIGGNSGQLDRLSQYSPDILKVDLYQLRNDAGNKVYKDILYSLSMLARKIGASLLFENIEINYQLQFAWLNGGRYYQGFYLKHPSDSFFEPDLLKEKLKEKCQDYIRYEKKHLEAGYEFADVLHKEISQKLMTLKKQSLEFDDLLFEVARHFTDKCFRAYICDENGFQVTSNVVKSDQVWTIEPRYKGKNWSWRPYFLENIIRMRIDKKGLLSDIYSDIDSGESIRTYSYPFGNGLYLFIDLSYEFLFEEDGLLF